MNMVNRQITEPSRCLDVKFQADVVICGGGPAGVSAAIAAAMIQKQSGNPVSVLLIESQGQLGGVWTSGLLSWIIDSENKPGVLTQLYARLDAHRQLMQESPTLYQRGRTYDSELMKWLLEQWVSELGIQVLLHTRVAQAVVSTDPCLTHVIVESCSGRQAVAGKVFVDATGDGALARLAGCDFELGIDDDDAQMPRMQPMSLMAIITGLDREELKPYYNIGHEPWALPKERLLAAIRCAGVEPSYTRPTLFEIYPDMFGLMVNHQYGQHPHDVCQITDATINARDEINRIIHALRHSGGIWEKLRLVATANHIGIRESTRPLGCYRVTLDDLIKGASHDDAVCRCTFGVDVHATSKTSADGGIEPSPVQRTLPYDIPYRALLSSQVDQLLFAGRCISGDFWAHASYRVTGNAVATGEAAGCAAALASARGCSPRALAFGESVLPELTNMRNDLCAAPSGLTASAI
jgi:ribulose 1,5-bisphosphate synthetase/thiazole synthase